jgi:hypothetical protein
MLGSKILTKGDYVMPFFIVRCKNRNCVNFLATPYFTDDETETGIKAAMKGSEPVDLTCGVCGYTANYTREDFGVEADKK